MLNDNDDQEVLNISDDGADTLSAAEVEVDLNDTDRGDDFVDPDKVKGGEADQGDDTPAGEGPDKGEAGAAIPPHRLGEMSREKNAGIDLGVGFMEGTIDRALVEELGGYKAVVKAIANKELSIEDLQSASPNDEARQAAPPVPAQQQVDTRRESANWDIDAKYIEYQEFVDAGETRDAAVLLRQISKEERVRERAEEVRVETELATKAHVEKLISAHPNLNIQGTPEHESVMVWADHFQRTLGCSRIEALDKAIEREGLTSVAPTGGVPPVAETPQQRVIRLRKEAAIKRGADVTNRQPPPMGLGATPAGAAPPRDLTKVPEHEFANASEEEKARARGDFL